MQDWSLNLVPRCPSIFLTIRCSPEEDGAINPAENQGQVLHARRYENKATLVQDIFIILQPELNFTTEGTGVAGDRTHEAQGLAEIMCVGDLGLGSAVALDTGYPMAVGIETTLQNGVIEMKHISTFDIVAGLPLFFDTLGGF